MDTRAKIVSAEQAALRAAGASAIVYAAGFDVLTAARVRRLNEIARSGILLIAAVQDHPDSLLPIRARAELAASLGIIDLVVIGPFSSGILIDDTEADARRTAELIQHVHRRNSHE